jgi:hypothetical protein
VVRCTCAVRKRCPPVVRPESEQDTFFVGVAMKTAPSSANGDESSTAATAGERLSFAGSGSRFGYAHPCDRRAGGACWRSRALPDARVGRSQRPDRAPLGGAP